MSRESRLGVVRVCEASHQNGFFLRRRAFGAPNVGRHVVPGQRQDITKTVWCMVWRTTSTPGVFFAAGGISKPIDTGRVGEPSATRATRQAPIHTRGRWPGRHPYRALWERAFQQKGTFARQQPLTSRWNESFVPRRMEFKRWMINHTKIVFQGITDDE